MPAGIGVRGPSGRLQRWHLEEYHTDVGDCRGAHFKRTVQPEAVSIMPPECSSQGRRRSSGFCLNNLPMICMCVSTSPDYCLGGCQALNKPQVGQTNASQALTSLCGAQSGLGRRYIPARNGSPPAADGVGSSAEASLAIPCKVLYCST